MADSGPIAILTASAGAGHNVAAQALQAAFAAAVPDEQVQFVDVLEFAGRFFRTVYAQGYLGIVNHAPTAMGLLYDVLDRPEARWREALRAHVQHFMTGRVRNALCRLNPRLIVNTHFLPAEIVAGLRRQGRLACPQVTVTTDFEAHRLWVQPPTEFYFTATDEGKAYLATCGVPLDRIAVTGIPVRPAFEHPAGDRVAERAALGLRPERRVLLLLCGGFGVGPTEQIFAELLPIADRAQIVAVCGRNEALRERLARRAANAADVRVLGYTDEMHCWMRAADLLISKPGGLTVSEALVCGLPLVIVNPIPGQEARNSDYLLEHGAAIKVNNPRLLGFRVRRLLDEPARLAALAAAAQRLARPGAASCIVSAALNLNVHPAPHSAPA